MSVAEWVLWGYLPNRIKVCRLKVGSLKPCNAEERRRVALGWVCGIYRQGTKPEGLIAQYEADERRQAVSP